MADGVVHSVALDPGLAPEGSAHHSKWCGYSSHQGVSTSMRCQICSPGNTDKESFSPLQGWYYQAAGHQATVADH